jgi:hypothetical protein
MFDVFKKHIIKNNQELLPFLNNAHIINISVLNATECKSKKDIKNNKRKKILNIYETIQLKHETTVIKIKDLLIFIIDKYKNQKGINNSRYFYILSTIHYNFIENNNRIAYNVGLILLTTLMGFDVNSDSLNILNDHQLKIQKKITALNGKNYILYEIRVIKDLGIEYSDSFTIINKKKSIKFKTEFKVFGDKNYFKTITQPCLNEFLDDIFLSVNYAHFQDLKNKGE